MGLGQRSSAYQRVASRAQASLVKRANWSAGHNMPGYTPEMDPYVTEDWESARSFLVDEMERDAESWINAGEGARSELAQLEEAIQDLHSASPNQGWSDIIGNSSYWIEPTDEEPEDDF